MHIGRMGLMILSTMNDIYMAAGPAGPNEVETRSADTCIHQPVDANKMDFVEAASALYQDQLSHSQ
jgi:hypothetical protein